MANENDINFRINTTADPKEVRNLGGELKQVGDIAEKSAQKANNAQREQTGIIGRNIEKIKELKKAIESADSEEEIEKLNKELKETEDNLERLKKLGKGTNLDIDSDGSSKKSADELKTKFSGVADGLGAIPGPAGDVAGSLSGIVQAGNPALIFIAAFVAGLAATFSFSKDAAGALAEESKAIADLKNITGIATLTAVVFNQAIKNQGGNASDLADIFNQLAGVVAEVKAGNKDLADSLRRFDITDISTLDKVVNQLAKSLATMPKDIQTVSDAAKLLGEEGVRQFSVLAPTILETQKKLEDLGLTSEAIQQRGLELNKSLQDSAFAFDALQKIVGNETAPAFTELNKNLSEFIIEIAKSKQAKQFFRDFAESLLAVIKATVAAKDVLKGLLDTVDPLVAKFTVFDNVLDSIANTGFPGLIKEIDRLNNTYRLGDRLLDQQIKLQSELNQKVLETGATTSKISKEQIDSLAAVTNAVESLITANTQLAESERLTAEERIQAIEKLSLEGGKTEKEAAVEIGEIRQQLANREIELLTENRNKIDEKVKQGYDLKKELADAEIALRQAVLDADKQATETKIQLEGIAAKEAKEQIEENRKDRQSAINEELAEIKDLEDKKDILKQQAARRRREIAINELEQQIAEEQSIIDSADVGEVAREEARKKLSDLVVKQAETDRQTEKAVQDAIVKDTQDAANQRIAEEKRISDETKKEADIRAALADQRKTADKVAFDEKITQLRQSGATAEPDS